MDYDPRFADELVDDELDREEARRKQRKGPAKNIQRPVPVDDPLGERDIPGAVVTYDDMRKALGKLLEHRGMTQEEINHLAMYLLSFFGFSDAIIDNILDTEDRDVFYMLEEEGILSTSREETYTLRGKIWRIHYWILRKREILKLVREAEEQKVEKVPAEFSVYDEVDPRVWARDD
jgi:uncharacterized protein DUF6015